MSTFKAVLVAATFIALAVPTVVTASVTASPQRVAGSLHDSTCPSVCIGHNGLADDIHATNVWCAWSGSHVRVHIRFFNSSGHDLDMTIQPTYHIRNHGRHGSSHSSRRSLHLSGHSWMQWFGDAGKPEDVDAGTPISSCEPSLKDISSS
jgi:hypothetical protein